MHYRARDAKARASMTASAIVLAIIFCGVLCAGNLLGQESAAGQQQSAIGTQRPAAVERPPVLNALAFDDPKEAELPSRTVLPPGVDLRHPEHMTNAQRLENGLAVDPKYDLNRIGARGIGEGMNFYSLEKERALGMQLSHEVEAQSAMISDPIITEYINRVAQNIVRNSDARVPFTVKVVDNEEVNAFALPGGFFYVNTGLILAADNEAELAGVMAHEIAHVAARHITKNATKAQIWNLASIPLIFVGGGAGYAIRQMAALAVPMTFLKFSRDMEREADLFGLEYQYKAGYDPGAFVQFFERIKAQEKHKHGALAKAFMTHPMNGDRVKQAQEEIDKDLPSKSEYILTTSEFDEVKARLMKLENEHRVDFGRNPRPTLRRRTRDRGGDSPASGDEQKSTQKNDQQSDDRPVLRRRTDTPRL